MRIAFDIDHTLWEIVKDKNGEYHQVPDYNLIQTLRWFHKNGDKIYCWSASGIDYTNAIVYKLGLDGIVEVIQKGKNENIDIAFDNYETGLAKVDITVKREFLS